MAIRKEKWITPMECEVEYVDGDRKVPPVVVNAILRKFRDGNDYNRSEFNRVMAELHWDNLNGCYFFTWAGMVCGVEENDGYIHT